MFFDDRVGERAPRGKVRRTLRAVTVPPSVVTAAPRGPSRRVGVFGGTFDPVHVGHLVAAVNARHTLGLDEVLLVVANVPWQKVGEREISPAPDRLAVVEAAVLGVPGLHVSRLEIDRGGPSYTADTLAELKRRAPEDELFVIVGADLVANLHTWERIEEVAELATLVIVNRLGAEAVEPEGDPRLAGFRAVGIAIPAIGISSTELRERVGAGRPLDYLVPERAIRVIEQRGLYSRGR
jgi:nicotinate-nucleotide adenylyltransferase